MKHLKSYILSLLSLTEDCSLCAELTKVVSKSKVKNYLAILYNKKNPMEKAILLLEPIKERPGDLEIVGLFSIGNDFGIKIISEMSFNLFFRESSHFFTFEALSVGTMWSVISALTKACQIPQGTKLEHNWMNFYLTRFNLLDSKKTNKRVNKQRDNEVDMDTQGVKDQFVQKRLKEREKEFVEPKKISLLCATWNVAQKIPHKALNEWFHLKSYDCDVYAIGLQEIDMSATAMLKEETDQGLAWDALLMNTFDPKKYEKVFSRQLVGIYNCVFVKRQHLDYLTDLKVDSVSVGVMGLIGNKGAISIRFQLYESSFCFTCAHLTAHQGKIEQRNHNFGEILNKSFGSLEYHPFKHDFCYWYGDMNYRTANLTYEEVLGLLTKSDYATILENDQLMIEKKGGRAFGGMKEEKIEFPPTYRYDFGTNIYDTSEKKRIPSYTDRILFRANEKDTTTSLLYTSIPAYTSSDHKPIVLIQEVMIKTVLEDRQKKIHGEILKEYEKMESDNLPDLQIREKEFIFGNVKIDTPVTKKLTLENTGQVAIQFGFVSIPGNDSWKPTWLNVSHNSGIILPGQKLEIDLTIHVTYALAPSLNFGKDEINSNMTIHLRNGGDFTISIKGNWCKSVFGSSLTNLVKEKGLKIPHELWRMVDFIYKNGLKSSGLFLEDSLPSEVEQVRDMLDLGENLKNVREHTVAEALLLFLESLEDSVIPKDFTEKCVSACGSQSAALNVVAKFPPVHFNCFNYLMAFLREMLFHPENKLNADELAIIFSNILFKVDHKNKSLYERKARMNFIKMFLIESMEYKIQDKKDI
jgi:phosphatidylinositol-bisphosphatase